MDIKDLKIGMLVIGNELADKNYIFTKTGWVGVVEAIGDDHFYARSFSLLDKDCKNHLLDPKHFDKFEPFNNKKGEQDQAENKLDSKGKNINKMQKIIAECLRDKAKELNSNIGDIARYIARSLEFEGFRDLGKHTIYMDTDFYTVIAVDKPFERIIMEEIRDFCKFAIGETIKGNGYAFVLTEQQIGKIYRKYIELTGYNI